MTRDIGTMADGIDLMSRVIVRMKPTIGTERRKAQEKGLIGDAALDYY